MDLSKMMSSVLNSGNPANAGTAGDPMQGMSPAEMESMKHMMDTMMKGDPAMKKQMEGYWKMLDGMAKDNPTEYKSFIDGQMKEMKDHH